MIRGFRYRLSRPIQLKGLEWGFFFATVLSLLFIAVGDVSHLQTRLAAPEALTAGQREMLGRARIIQEVLSRGELKLTPARYFEVLGETES